MGGRGSTSQGKRAKMNMAVENISLRETYVRAVKRPPYDDLGEVGHFDIIKAQVPNVSDGNIFLLFSTIEHLEKFHEDAVEDLLDHGDEAVKEPNIIFQDMNEKRGTAFVYIKRVGRRYYKAVVKVETEKDHQITLYNFYRTRIKQIRSYAKGDRMRMLYNDGTIDYNNDAN